MQVKINQNKIGVNIKKNNVKVDKGNIIVPKLKGINYNRSLILIHKQDIDEDYAYYFDNIYLSYNKYFDYEIKENALYTQTLNPDSDYPFKTLKYPNSFGNYNRFTDMNGLQEYNQFYTIDHLTGLGWNFDFIEMGSMTQEELLNFIPTQTYHGFDNYRIPSQKVFKSLNRDLVRYPLDYLPFSLNNIVTKSKYFITCTRIRNSNEFVCYNLLYNTQIRINYTENRGIWGTMPCRVHYK